MTETILQLLTRLSEAGDDAILSGSVAESHYGSEFDRLLRKRVLVEAAPISDWDVCDRCECGMISRPIRQNGDQYQADCPLDPREDVVLSAEDVRSFRINLNGLAREISTIAGLRSPAEAVAGGLWKLGETEAGRLVFLIFQTSVLKLEGLLPIMRRLSGSGSVTLVAPRPKAESAAYLIDAGVHVVGFETVFAAHCASRDNAVLDPPSEEAELVVHVQSGAVEWRNCLISFPHQLFPSLRRLVDKALSRDTLASKAYLEDTTGRAASDLVREMRDKIVASGFSQADAKDRLVLSRGDYHWQHEPCLYAVKKTGKGHWAGDRKQTTLWQIANKDQDAETVHGTQKPVECMRRPILNNSSPGQAVYEPFLGSGTTLIAAETTGRVCLGIELNPAYVDVAVQRWQQFTGQAAVLDGIGQTFADLTANPR